MKPIYYILYRFYKFAQLFPEPDRLKYSRPGVFLAIMTLSNADTLVTSLDLRLEQLSINVKIVFLIAWIMLWWWIFSRPGISNKMKELEAMESRNAVIIGNLITGIYVMGSLILWTRTSIGHHTY